jgi:hypothetical protein
MFGSTGCSNKDLYNNLQRNQRQLCDKEPQSTYDGCAQKFSKSYKKYKAERKELLEKQKTDE